MTRTALDASTPLSVKEAAREAGVSPSLVYAWCRERRLPHRRLGREGRRGAIRIRREDLAAFLVRCEQEGPLAPPVRLKHISIN